MRLLVAGVVLAASLLGGGRGDNPLLPPVAAAAPAGETAAPAPAKPHVVVAYLTSWGLYNRHYGADAVPAGRLTHLNYAFAKISPSGEMVLGDPWADTQVPFPNDAPDQALKGNFNQLRLLKARHPQLKTLISVGGWTWSGRFSDVALTAASRARFARSAVKFVVRYGFDGVDIDWEYPVGGGLAGNANRPEDRHNFTLLMAELRRQLSAQGARDGKHYLLTAAIGARQAELGNIELTALARSLDWFNLMTYDAHGVWDGMTGEHAALWPSARSPFPREVRLTYNVDAAVTTMLGAGVSAGKIVVGVPFYGRGWQHVAAANGGLYQQASPLPPPGTGEKGASGSGTNDYADILRLIRSGHYTRHWDREAAAPYLYSADRHGGHFISYEDRESLGRKIAYVRKMGLRGMMAWELAADSTTPSDSLLWFMSRGLLPPERVATAEGTDSKTLTGGL